MAQTFDQFNAALLYCNQCRKAMPVRERLLLVLPDGELYDYTCQGCNSSVGSKTERAGLKQPLSKTRIGGSSQ
jgi:hypothetical protein